MTGTRAAPPPGSRKVPGFKVWMTEDGTPYGVTGRLTTWVHNGCVNANATMDSGGKRTRGVCKMMHETWMPPKPEGAYAAHLDGDATNNAASNLAWAPRLPHRAYREKWAARTLAEMEADPSHPKHGTRTGYDAGCRCRMCRNAARLCSVQGRLRGTIRRMSS